MQQDVFVVIGYNDGFVVISDGDKYILSADSTCLRLGCGSQAGGKSPG